MKLSIRYFKSTDIRWNQDILNLPYGKARLLLFLLVEAKTMMRSRICELLWPEVEELQARRSLRNAIYEIRKRTSQELIESKGKDMICLSPQVQVDFDLELDVASLWSEMSMDALLRDYEGDFLFFENLHSSWELEAYIQSKATYYRKRRIELLERLIPQATSQIFS